MKAKQTFLELSDLRSGAQVNGFLLRDKFTRKRGLTNEQRILRKICARVLFS